MDLESCMEYFLIDINIDNVAIMNTILNKITLNPKPWIAKRCFTFFNLYNVIYFRYLCIFKNYRGLKIKDNVKNGIFKLFVKNEGDNTKVIKIPKRNNIDSLMFYFKLIKPRGFKEYLSTMTGLKDLPYLKSYIIKPNIIYRNGGYETNYLRGVNLFDLRYDMLYNNFIPDEILSYNITSQIKELLYQMNIFYKVYGYICGDWPLHNLVYDLNNKKISNVDLEGFYTYQHYNIENNIEYLRNIYNELICLLDKTYRKDEIELCKALDIIRYTSTNDVTYNAKGFYSGYHSIYLKGKKYKGQRDCLKRLKSFKYDFKNKVVLDLGCNIGGMLHPLSDNIKHGIGIDYDPKCINAANLIKQLNHEQKLEFYNFNLETEKLDLIKNFLGSKQVDICFVLAISMWIKNWKEVIAFCSKISKETFFETNGTVI